ncbi:hypothetical protein NLJ89_g8876 [Agrocybe chaxingu]|uniref:WLM-domain-containing protein n=1 Tax=Agrocybe chaxingu TaxID=84603 RepID=A0A9W8JUL4_9AGAR|nr:hypothetical protein NLJ89_g8876 [Agrocybe chaxingu]
MSSDTPNPLSLTVSFRGKQHVLSLLPESTLSALYAQLEELTQVPPPLQKLLFKGKKLSGGRGDHDISLGQAGMKDGTKIQLVAPTLQELEGMRTVENENQKRERIMRERALKAPVKLRSTGSGPIASLSSSSSPSLQYRFHDLKALDHLSNPDTALALLKRLSEDSAIRHVMEKHKFAVGLLTELAPHEHPKLLGLNQNAGQTILLRLRTDKYDGFRLYKDIRMVLCHELTHNVWGDHDENANTFHDLPNLQFKELNSKLNREVAEYERSVSAGTHYLSGGPDVYQPLSELEAEARAYTLGGSGASASSSSFNEETQEERRQKLLQATMNRLRKEEEEIEHSCGTGKSTA